MAVESHKRQQLLRQDVAAPSCTWYVRLSGRVRRIQILSLRKWLAM